MIQWAYGDDQINSDETLRSTCLLAALNEQTEKINKRVCSVSRNVQVLNMLPGTPRVYTSVDRCSDVTGNNALPPTVFNKQLPSGMPPHELHLKEGAVVILLRNLKVPAGLCNGFRLRVDEMKDTV